MRYASAVLLGMLLALVAQFGASAAWGQTFVISSVAIRSTYDDHALGRTEPDEELTLSPSLSVDMRQDISRLLFKGRIDAFRYLDHSAYGRENAQASVDWSRTLSERLGLRMGLSWSRDHTLENEYEQSGLVTAMTQRDTYTVSPGLTYNVTERDQVDCDMSGTMVDPEPADSVDYTVVGVTTTWSHALGDGLWKLVGQVGGQRYLFERTDGSTEQHVLSVLSGVVWKPSELLEIQAMGGLSRTSSSVRYDTYSWLDMESSSTTYSGSLTGTWTDQVWRLSLAADRSESPSTYGELITRDRLRLTFGRNLSERLYLGLQTAFYTSKTAGLVQDQESRTYSGGPTLNYRLTEDARIESGYAYTREENMLTGTVTDRNRAWLGYSVDFPHEF